MPTLISLDVPVANIKKGQCGGKTTVLFMVMSFIIGCVDRMCQSFLSGCLFSDDSFWPCMS